MLNQTVSDGCHIRIKKVRLALGLSQRDFGAHLGVSRDVISNLENRRVAPRITFLMHLCKLFSVAPEYLLRSTGDMFSNLSNQANEPLQKATALFIKLDSPYQDYVLQQMRELLKLQEHSTSTQH